MVFQYVNEQKYEDFHSLDQEESRYFQYNSQNQKILYYSDFL